MTDEECCDTLTATGVPRFTYNSVTGRAVVETEWGGEIQFRIKGDRIYFWSKKLKKEYGFPLEEVIELITE